MSNPMRVSLQMTPETLASIQDAAKLSGHSEADTVARAVKFWALVQLCKAHGGAVYLRETPDGDLTEFRYDDEV